MEHDIPVLTLVENNKIIMSSPTDRARTDVDCSMYNNDTSSVRNHHRYHDHRHSEVITLGYIEFYAGIGGWTLALDKACSDIATDADYPHHDDEDDEQKTKKNPKEEDQKNIVSQQRRKNGVRIRMKRLASYEHSDLCNSVYAYNFVPQALPPQQPQPVRQTQTQQQQGGDSQTQSTTGNSCTTPDKRKKKKMKTGSSSASASAHQRPPNSTLPKTSIEQLTLVDLDNVHAGVSSSSSSKDDDASDGNTVDDVIWAMSPPCQPHTRQHTNHTPDDELKDVRSQSFLHLLSLLDELCQRHHNCQIESRCMQARPPKIILVENVVGFEQSVSCQRLRSTLRKNHYEYTEFQLNPTQIGISNDRPRYYLVASLKETNGNSRNNSNNNIYTINTELPRPTTISSSLQEQDLHLPAIETYLDKDLPPIAIESSAINQEKLDLLRIPLSTITKPSSWCFDIVFPQSRRSSCFTSSYSRMSRGTGSILYYGNSLKTIELSDPSQRQFDPSWWHTIIDSTNNDSSSSSPSPSPSTQVPLRYFSQTEMARLMGFPLKGDSTSASTSLLRFEFPPWCTHRQAVRLLGNSINVSVSSRLCELAMREYIYG